MCTQHSRIKKTKHGSGGHDCWLQHAEMSLAHTLELSPSFVASYLPPRSQQLGKSKLYGHTHTHTPNFHTHLGPTWWIGFLDPLIPHLFSYQQRVLLGIDLDKRDAVELGFCHVVVRSLIPFHVLKLSPLNYWCIWWLVFLTRHEYLLTKTKGPKKKKIHT